MKWITIAVLGLLVIIVGIVLLFGTKTPAPQTQTTNTVTLPVAAQALQSPAEFATDFYTWYISNREKGPSFPTPNNLTSVLGPWLTPQFIANWQTIITNTDADPVLWAQDNPATWGHGITASIVSQSNSASSVRVLIGSGKTTHTFTLQLVKSGNSWRIDSVAGTF